MATHKGIIYCRVSSQEQVQGTSLDNQKSACLEYAEKKGIQILKIFTEKGESATAANRTELIKALDYCKEHKGEIDGFIVWKVDRFARSQIDHFALRAQLMKYGVTLHSVTEPINDDPIGKMTEGVLAAYAQFENDIRKQRCTAGMMAKLKDGIWCWQPPIGYINSKKRLERRKTIPDEPDSDRFFLIQKGLKEYAKGDYTVTTLTELFNKWGLTTRTGKPMFKQLVERMLRDKFYAGILVNPWTEEEYQGKHDPMISIEEFQRIQLIKRGLSNNAIELRLKVHPDFPLRRFVFCTCGQKYTASWRIGRNKKYPYYHCNNRICMHYTHAIAKSDMENKFTSRLEEVKPVEEFLKYFEEVILDTWRNQYTAIKQERKHYENELKRLELKRENLLQMRINSEISQEEFLKLKDGIENQIAGYRISSNESQTDEFDMESAILYAVQFLRNVDRQWFDEEDVKRKQRLQKMVFPEGIIYDKATGNFGTAKLSCIFELNRTFDGNRSHFVAGAGIAPAPGGYEPPEILLLYPAIL